MLGLVLITDEGPNTASSPTCCTTVLFFGHILARLLYWPVAAPVNRKMYFLLSLSTSEKMLAPRLRAAGEACFSAWQLITDSVVQSITRKSIGQEITCRLRMLIALSNMIPSSIPSIKSIQATRRSNIAYMLKRGVTFPRPFLGYLRAPECLILCCIWGKWPQITSGLLNFNHGLDILINVTFLARRSLLNSTVPFNLLISKTPFQLGKFNAPIKWGL